MEKINLVKQNTIFIGHIGEEKLNRNWKDTLLKKVILLLSNSQRSSRTFSVKNQLFLHQEN